MIGEVFVNLANTIWPSVNFYSANGFLFIDTLRIAEK